MISNRWIGWSVKYTMCNVQYYNENANKWNENRWERKWERQRENTTATYSHLFDMNRSSINDPGGYSHKCTAHFARDRAREFIPNFISMRTIQIWYWLFFWLLDCCESSAKLMAISSAEHHFDDWEENKMYNNHGYSIYIYTYKGERKKKSI